MPRNRCDDSSTVHHREVRPSPETSESPASNYRLFDNYMEAVTAPQLDEFPKTVPRVRARFWGANLGSSQIAEPPQVRAKSKN